MSLNLLRQSQKSLRSIFRCSYQVQDNFNQARGYASQAKWVDTISQDLEKVDPEIHDLLEKEKNRIYKGLELIPSENLIPTPVLQAIGSVATNKYSEGYPGKRYYGGNEFIDEIESLCQQRALAAYDLDPTKWGVNVQPYSGSPANFQVFTGLLQPHERILALDLPYGGHLSHGYQTATKKISAVSIFFETLSYKTNDQTGLLDYDQIEEIAKLYKPKILIAGYSAYCHHYDYKRMKEIADLNNSVLVSDMAHISGLVAGKVAPSPFEYSDVVTTTTHKSLRGARGAMIFYRIGEKGKDKNGKPIMYDLGDRINFSVFPGLQGGPHNNNIAGIAVALKHALSQDFKDYQKQVVDNSKALAEGLKKRGYELVSGGTSNHMVLVDLRPKGIDGSRVERVMELAHMAANKNTVPGDKSAMVPSGLRMGTPALTTRGFLEKDFDKVAEFVDKAVDITKKIKSNPEVGSKIKDFRDYLDKEVPPEIIQLRDEVETFAKQFPTIGYEQSTMKYKD